MENSRHAVAKTKKNRDDRLELRLESAEKQAFQEAADLAGLPLSAWVRERLRRSAFEELRQFGRPVSFVSTTGNQAGPAPSST